MCNAANCSHVLNDDITDLFGDIDLNTSPEERAKNIARKGDLAAFVNKQYKEPCRSCRGSGTFISWAGRPVGPCRKCKGTGKLVFKTSPQQRQSTKQSYQKRQAEKARDRDVAIETFKENNEAEYNWLQSNTGKFEFATSVRNALYTYGSLTEGQLNAIRKCIIRDEERKAARNAANISAIENAPECDVSKIEKTFAVAQSNGVKRPKLRLADYIFSLAPAHGVNAGAIYVVARESKDYLGKIVNGKFVRNTYNCTEQQAAEIAVVASDPEAAAVAYGQRFGQCSICNRKLTVSESIDRMMGPICAEKYGWS